VATSHLRENPKGSVLRRYGSSFEDSVFLSLNDNSRIERGTAEEEPEADTLEAEHRGRRAPIRGLDTARRATDRRGTVGAEAIGLSLGSDVRSASKPRQPFGPLRLCHVRAALAVHLVNKAPKEHLDVREPSHPGNVG
jgi:hypothetical protein